MIDGQEEPRAIAAYEELCAMDSTREARAELLASGVSRGAAESLYPRSFEPIAAPLAAYLKQHGRSLYWVSLPALNAQRRDTEAAIWALSEDQFEEWLRTTPVSTENWDDQAWYPLKAAIDELHPSEGAPAAVIAILWGAWWLVGHRDQLGDVNARQRAIGCMSWIIRNVLPELGSAA